MPIRTISQSINLQKQPDSNLDKYITEIGSNGITVHPEGQDNTNYLQIASDVGIVRNGISVAEYGENVRIGKEDGTKVIIADGSISPYTTAGTYIVGKVNGVDTVLAEFGASGAQIGLSSAGNVVVDNDSVDIKDGSTVVATFGINGSQIGQNGQSRIIEDAYSMQMIDKEHHNYLKIKDLRGESGVYEIRESFRSDGVTTYYGLSLNAIEEEGVYQINVTFYPSSYHYSGTITRYNHGIEFDPPIPNGYYIRARYKSDSAYCKEYTLGSRRVYGDGSSDQVGPMSTVIGAFNSAEAFASCGEGYDTHSRGICSHAEGWETYADGNYSHSQNMHTSAYGEAQTAIGKWNESDYNNEYALIVGNGSQGTPSNALTVDWSGNVEAAGDITDGTGNILSDKKPSAYVHMYVSNKTLNNTATQLTGLSIIGGGNYEDYFDIGTANQVKIKKTGRYHVEIFMRFSSVTNAANVKRISIYKNGAEGSAVFGRVNSYEDVTYWDNLTYAAGDILTMYGRSEDGNATVSYPRVMLTPLF